MKIEKLTENKIRVILSTDDLEQSKTNLEKLISPSIESQNLFLDILSKAEKEVGFYTDGCKLLIEAFSSYDELFIFTITKYSEKDYQIPYDNSLKKKVSIRKKEINLKSKNAIYSFENFDTFCDFCNNLNKISILDIKKVSKNISLYLYKDTYYILLKNIDTEYKHLIKFYSSISEFAKLVVCSQNFENKLLEHGKIIIKKDAISTCIKHFIHKKN